MLKKGDIVWRMLGSESGDKVFWEANGKTVVSVDDKGWYKLSDGTGGSPGNVGKNVYLTKEQAIEKFLERHDGFITEKTSDNKCKNCLYYVVKGTGIRVNDLGKKEHFMIKDCSLRKCIKN